MSEPGQDDHRLRDLIRAELDDQSIDLTVDGGRVVAASRELVGLALSGGGIRSATFNLGLLQGLERIGLLERLDYLSTVSGGGYVGSFWTAWRARRAAPRGDPPTVSDRNSRARPRFRPANPITGQARNTPPSATCASSATSSPPTSVCSAGTPAEWS